MGNRVVVKSAEYRYETLRPLFFAMMDGLGGEEIAAGTTVLIKPNLLTAAKPEEAVVTHPLIVRAAMEYVLDRRGRPLISDSPGMGSFARVLGESGITRAMGGLDGECRPFHRTVKTDVGEPFGMIDLAEDALTVDAIINLPKLKTHGQMGLSLGVKNLFGCVVGLRKIDWHLRAGVNRDLFGRLLVQIHERINPTFTVLDGILALEGEGPGKRGTPRHIGVLMGSRNAFAVKESVCRMIGLPPERLPVWRAARSMGLAREAVEITGDLPHVPRFRLPLETPLVFGPAVLQGFIRRHLLARPVCDAPLCRGCTKCAEICPARAISFVAERPRFAYDACIRCYCCSEMCPHGALHAVEPVAGKLFRRLTSVR